MEKSERAALFDKSVAGKNRRLQWLLTRRDEYLPVCREALESLLPLGQESTPAKDMIVCARVRPLLDYEIEAGLFGTAAASKTRVRALDPRIGVRGDARAEHADFDVDLAFGADDDNATVHASTALPLVDLALSGGVATMLAYGQTGSGKTHTIQGVLDRLAVDLFERQEKKGLLDENRKSCVSLHLSYYELLGNNAVDLLDEARHSVDIMEDKFGKINVVGATEVQITSSNQFAELLDRAVRHRRTRMTFKNDASSRSHAVCALRVQNTRHPSAEDGRMFIIDLAGSENSADAQFHDKSLVAETRAINKSLMALKDCVHRRALFAVSPDTFYHIPYRLSKLTLLLKDAFELESYRLCRTVVIACVSPSCADVAQTLNTLRYAGPIRVGSINRRKAVENPNNPAHWSNETLRKWVLQAYAGQVDPEVLCPYESGMQLLRIPETEFLDRIMTSNAKIGEKKAKVLYTKLWKRLIDARTADRRRKLKPKGKRTEERLMEQNTEIIAAGDSV